MKITQFPHMPSVIKVKILKPKTGKGFFAELPDYDVFTEADTEMDLDKMINDLIYEIFEVPKDFQYKIKYIRDEMDKKIINTKKLVVMSTADIIKKTMHA